MGYKISVIVPVFGVERFIKRCADSLMRQNFHDVEFIFVNDCTTDNSIGVLKEVVSRYPNRKVQIINKQVNEGLPKARETGCKFASGEYIYHMDSDDWLDENGLSEMYQAVSVKNADILCCGFIKDFGDREQVVLGKYVKSPKEGIDMMLHSEEQMHSGVWCKMVRRELYKDVVFPPTFMHEDLALMIQLFYYAKTIAYLPKAYYHYIQTNSESMIHQDTFRRDTSAALNFHFIVDFMKKVNIEQIHKKELVYRINTFKTYSLYNGKLIDETLYPESNRYIYALNDIKDKKMQFYAYCAIHHCSFLYRLIHMLKIVLKKILRK